MLKRVLIIMSLMCVALWTVEGFAGEDFLLDSFQYATPAAAKAAWVPGGAGQDPQPDLVDNVPCLTLPCVFTSQTARATWDKSVNLDLSGYDRFYFRIKVTNPGNFKFVTFYFLTGSGGWWTLFEAVPLLSDQWQTVVIDKSEFSNDGNCTGWNDIRRIRISPWQAIPGNSTISIADFKMQRDDYVVDNFQYASPEAARAAWLPGQAGQNPQPATVDAVSCLTFPCNFTSQTTAGVWDKTVALNLSEYEKISAKIKCDNPSVVQGIDFEYFTASGGSWVAANVVPLQSNQWQTVEIPKTSFTAQGQCNGWSDIRAVRLRVRQLMAGTTNVSLADLRTKMTPENFLINSSFEVCTTELLPDQWGTGHWGMQKEEWVLDTDAWRARWGVDTSFFRTGKQSLRIVGAVDNTELCAVGNPVNVSAGKEYTFSAWVRSNVARNVTLSLVVWSGGHHSQQFSLGSTWTHCAITISAPISDTKMTCGVWPTGNGTIWIDDVKFECNDTATAWRPAAKDVMLDGHAVHRSVPAIEDWNVTPGEDIAQVTLDSNRRFLINGQPFIPFALGWERTPSQTVIEYIARTGFNTVCFYVQPTATVDELRNAFDVCKNNGLKVIPWLPWEISLSAVQNWVVALRNHPALIAWYVYDEPSVITPEIQSRYDLVKQLDPNHPVYINYYFYTQNQLGQIASLDRYPIPFYSLEKVGVDGFVMHNVSVDKPSWIWLQNHGYAYGTAREPTGPEVEAMTYLTLVKGIRGFKYFIHKPHGKEIWDYMRHLTREIRFLTPIVSSLETPLETSCSTDAVSVLSKTWQGENYLVTVNSKPSPVNAAISVPVNAFAAEVLFENRQVNIVDNQIVDEFDGFQRHVYRILPVPDNFGVKVYSEDFAANPAWIWDTQPVVSIGNPGGILQTNGQLMIFYPTGYASVGSARDTRTPITVASPGKVVTVSSDHWCYYGDEPAHSKTLSYTVVYTDNTQEIITHTYSSLENDATVKTFAGVRTLPKAVKQIKDVTVSIDRGSDFTLGPNYFYWDNLNIYVLPDAAPISGDANADGMVDVGDLGILAANYGTPTGATWSQGDFNADGAVDVGDLGILAAHYGEGTNQTLDFNKDSQALGLSVNNEDIADESDQTTSVLGCELLGLPLLAGIFLAGLLLSRLQWEE